jgi:uncharacterized protein YcbX
MQRVIAGSFAVAVAAFLLHSNWEVLTSPHPLLEGARPAFLLLGCPVIFALVAFVLSRRPRTLRVKEIWVFPVKSCAGIRVDSCKLNSHGFLNDRKWMFVTPQGKFLTQREAPGMRLIEPSFDPATGDLVLSVPSINRPLRAVQDFSGLKPIDVEIWGSNVHALDYGEEAAEWATEFFKKPARLAVIRAEGEHKRPVSIKYGGRAGLKCDETDKVQVAFADAFPFLLATTNSLDDLNHRLVRKGEQPIPMINFRANIIVEGCR